ncbi:MULTISPECIES: RNA-binding domain-containing protein [unclassified Lentimonas]|uniref:RNA-binding domain-containing protein n=1 Tax=unclassified Lentimonas TaxID=2630993 RepID=UPI0013245AA0|nr:MULTISPECIES: RNA-binding domain-containing protein [unclassified Lentimonas]CAA6676382.1 Unannotated [Lentimonas sp. CC4]CAA6685221.1 Unannotated [Lentimonas sp. CC6]CAA6693410.1 Unannotated [Lentimonas sp. CC19]CAA6696480.1 Unannotated [Lentimonas sp. CC10]CAA7072383.1 Unannotated [Lentimonas sp. CC11]
MPASDKSLSKHFLRDFFIALVVLIIIGLGPAIYFVSQAERDVSESFIENSAERAANEFRNVGSSTESSVRMARQWGESELLTLKNPESMYHLLFPIIQQDSHHCGIMIADTDGQSYQISEVDGGLQTTHTYLQGNTRVAEVKYWKGGQIVSRQTEPTTYDPRSRPWFYPALNNEAVYWTEPYQFFSRKVVGVTASTSIPSTVNDAYQMVVAFDISMEHLYANIQKMQPSPNSQIFIFRRDEALYTVGNNADISSQFKALHQTNNELAQKAHAAWRQDQLDDRIIPVRHDNQLWWCGFRPLNKTHRNTWIGVMVPENDTSIGANKRHAALAGITGVSLCIAAAFSFLLAKRQTRHSGGPAVAFEPENAIESIRDIIQRGESKRREFKSTMRLNLHTNKPGKEIEIAWLKGLAAFLNTEGGTLLIGVTDDGEITGLEADKFESEDHAQLHFKNLIAEHIGAEFSKYIDFRTVQIDEKLVGIAECIRSNEPVFLKHSKGESFFIRNGPSSDELPISQALDYIKAGK